MTIATQQDLQDALAAGGDVYCDPNSLITLDQPMQVRAATRIIGANIACPAGPAFQGSGSGISFDHVTITGAGLGTGAYDATQKLIQLVGTKDAPLSGIDIHDCHLSGSLGDNVWLEWCTDSKVHHNTIEHYLYSGIMLISGTDIEVDGNIISDAPLTDGVVNTYGIAASDLTNIEADRSRDITITGNHVSLVDWEGIDTHGGLDMTITGNTVEGCPRGIALVTGNDSRLTTPWNCVVTGNTVDDIGCRRAPLAGVYLSGKSGTSASATITGNQVVGYTGAGQYAFFAGYYSRDNTFIGSNNRPFVPWTDITLNPDYSANTGYRPQYMVDGDRVFLRGGVIPGTNTGRPLGVAARQNIGTLTNMAAWPPTLSFLGMVKGSNGGAGNFMLAVDPTGGVHAYYGAGTDTYTYFLGGTYISR